MIKSKTYSEMANGKKKKGKNILDVNQYKNKKVNQNFGLSEVSVIQVFF